MNLTLLCLNNKVKDVKLVKILSNYNFSKQFIYITIEFSDQAHRRVENKVIWRFTPYRSIDNI
jgi:hypothetical protein